MSTTIHGSEFYFTSDSETEEVYDEKSDAIEAVGSDLDAIEEGETTITHVEVDTDGGFTLTVLPARIIYKTLLEGGQA